MPRLKFWQQPMVGYENIDVAACSARGVRVANLAGFNAVAVAEHTIMLALASLKRLIPANAAAHAGRWGQQELMSEPGILELAGKTWGIIGFGATGREVAKRLVAWDVTLLYFDVHRLAPHEDLAAHVTYTSLDDLLPLADIVSVHVPLMEETRGLIGARELDMMKPQAVLINVSRGKLADEQAIAGRLRTKRLRGAGIDVFPHEPISPDDPLLALDNAILTPHIAGVTNEARARALSWAIANLVRFLQGQPPRFMLNPDLPEDMAPPSHD
jgi:phosphoglycerate dehydrogenase-like enzyme